MRNNERMLTLLLQTTSCILYTTALSLTPLPTRYHNIQNRVTSPHSHLHRLSTITPSFITDTPSIDENSLELDDETEIVEKSERFDWFKSWYPLVAVEALDKEKPHHFHLLGMDVCVWNDSPLESHKGGSESNALFGSKKSRPKRARRSSSGKWRAFVDECPHRKVPLSEGRVEDDGSLLCSYHAWRFDGDGSCITVPQYQEGSDEMARVLANPKTKCNSFPTKVINGILFVWPDAGKDAVLESELTPVVYRPIEELEFVGPLNFRELPYGIDFFFENAMDPAHVPVSHHNIVGNRYMELPMNVTTEKPLNKQGFAIGFRSANFLDGVVRDSTTTFHAPSLIEIDIPFDENQDGARQTIILYASPSRPGFSNFVGHFAFRKDRKGRLPNALRFFTLPLPKWVDHIMSSAFINQDALFLHHQERYMHRTGMYTTHFPEDDGSPSDYAASVYPVNTDKGVLLFRNWLRRFSAGRVPYRHQLGNEATVMPPPSSDVVFDVWNAHTKHCRYCLGALANLKKLRIASIALAICTGVCRPQKLGAVGSLVTTLGFAGLAAFVTKVIGMFYKHEYSHAEND